MSQDAQVKINPGLPWRISVHQEEGSMHLQTGLRFKEEISKVLHLEYSFMWC
jgi:hypothetical protein